jgi:hypothetical protein
MVCINILKIEDFEGWGRFYIQVSTIFSGIGLTIGGGTCLLSQYYIFFLPKNNFLLTVELRMGR